MSIVLSPSLLTLMTFAASQGVVAPPDRRAQLAQLSQRLTAGDVSAIDDLLSCTKPASPDSMPSSEQVERLRAEVTRLRAERPVSPPQPAVKEARPATPRDLDTTLREARAWLRADDPNHCLKVLPPGDGEVLYRRACALERLGRDEEALDAYRRVAASATSPLMKIGAASGVDHIEWRRRRARAPESKP